MDPDLVEVLINVAEGQEEGELRLDVTEGADLVRLYADSNKTPLEAMTWQLDAQEPPERFFIEGVAASGARGDVELGSVPRITI